MHTNHEQKTMSSLQTALLYEGSERNMAGLRPDAPAIFPATAYLMSDLEMLASTCEGGGYSYNRTGNPNRDDLASVLSYLESGESSLIFASGMAAISSALLSQLGQGAHIVANRALYGETIDFMNHYLGAYGVTVSYVDFSNLKAVEEAIRPETKVVYTEVISNPLTRIVDIKGLAKISHEAGACLMVDSTFTTPLLIKPLSLGADLVIHSLTKYIGGHSDVTAGSVTGSKQKVAEVFKYQHLLGSCADPFSAWLLLRSVRTLELRVGQQMKNAERLATFLVNHPKILRVNHPSLTGHPEHELAKSQLANGFGAILSFSVPDDRAKINAFMRQLKLVQYLPSLGGYRTTLSHPVSSSHADVPEADRLLMGIHDGLIRVSLGMEGIQDLIEDFEQALSVF